MLEISPPSYNCCFMGFLGYLLEERKTSNPRVWERLLKVIKRIDFTITEKAWMQFAGKIAQSVRRAVSEELLVKALKRLKEFILKIEGNIITCELFFSLGIAGLLSECMKHGNGLVVLEACELMAGVVTESRDNFTLQKACAETKLLYEVYEFFTPFVKYEEESLDLFCNLLLQFLEEPWEEAPF